MNFVPSEQSELCGTCAKETVLGSESSNMCGISVCIEYVHRVVSRYAFVVNVTCCPVASRCHCHVLSGAIVRGRLGGQLVISRINTRFSFTYFSHDAFDFVAQNWEGFVCGHILVQEKKSHSYTSSKGEIHYAPL